MSDQQVSPLESASIRLGLTSSLSPEIAITTGSLGMPYAAEPPHNGPNPAREAWNRVDRDSAIPVRASPVLRTPVPLTAMGNGGPLRRAVDVTTVDSLNRLAFSTFTYQSDQLNREMYQRARVPAGGPQFSINLPQMVQNPPQPPLAVQLPIIAQQVQVSSTVENLLPLQSPTVDPSTTMSSATETCPVAAEHPTAEAQSEPAPHGLRSIPSFSAAFAVPSATLPQLPAVDRVATGRNLQAQRSRTSTFSSALATGSPSDSPPTHQSPNTSLENSPHTKSEHDNANFASANTAAPPAANFQHNTASTTGFPPHGAQPSLLVGIVGLVPNNDLNGPVVQRDIKLRKRNIHAQEIDSQELKVKSSSSCELDSDSDLDLFPPGFVRDQISGEIRKRSKMDDSPKCMRTRDEWRWKELCGKSREDRGPMDGYEEGDSDLDFDEWKKAKKERRETKKRKLAAGESRN